MRLYTNLVLAILASLACHLKSRYRTKTSTSLFGSHPPSSYRNAFPHRFCILLSPSIDSSSSPISTTFPPEEHVSSCCRHVFLSHPHSQAPTLSRHISAAVIHTSDDLSLLYPALTLRPRLLARRLVLREISRSHRRNATGNRSMRRVSTRIHLEARTAGRDRHHRRRARRRLSRSTGCSARPITCSSWPLYRGVLRAAGGSAHTAVSGRYGATRAHAAKREL